jgi:hypothetical protein
VEHLREHFERVDQPGPGPVEEMMAVVVVKWVV